MSTDTPLESIAKDDCVLAEAAPEQRTLTWQLNGASWAGPMTLDEYIGRERLLSETALSANGGTRYFVLHHKSNPNLIVSACEVLSKKALVARPASATTAPATVEQVAAYGLASVFTPPPFRGCGLASHMLRLVQNAVDAGGLDAEFGALYSDIGRSFYTRLGWPDFPSPQVTIQVQPGFNAGCALGGAEAETSLFTDADVPSLCEADCALLRAHLERVAASSSSSSSASSSSPSGGEDEKTYIAFLPDYTQISWHFARASYVAEVMRQGREIKNRGAKTRDGESWLYWDHDLRESKLKILRVVIGERENDRATATAAAKALLRAAVKEAQDWDLPKVLVWAPGEAVSLAATELWREGGGKLGVVFDEREDGSIPSLRWKGGEHVERVVWEANEYYAWC